MARKSGQKYNALYVWMTNDLSTVLNDISYINIIFVSGDRTIFQIGVSNFFWLFPVKLWFSLHFSEQEEASNYSTALVPSCLSNYLIFNYVNWCGWNALDQDWKTNEFKPLYVRLRVEYGSRYNCGAHLMSFLCVCNVKNKQINTYIKHVCVWVY